MAAREGRGAAAYLGVGCFTTIAGFFGGGMIALLLGLIVEGVRGCKPPEGLPICNSHLYYFPGGLIGMVFLPAVVLWRLRSGDRAARAENNK
jgi:hypothetical protein